MLLQILPVGLLQIQDFNLLKNILYFLKKCKMMVKMVGVIYDIIIFIEYKTKSISIDFIDTYNLFQDQFLLALRLVTLKLTGNVHYAWLN